MELPVKPVPQGVSRTPLGESRLGATPPSAQSSDWSPVIPRRRLSGE